MPRAPQGGHEPVGEMQPGGRRGHRALIAGKHGLIVGAVGLVDRTTAGDIRRQRHLSALGDRLVEDRAMKGEGERHLAALAFCFDGGVKLTEKADTAFGAEPDHIADR